MKPVLEGFDRANNKLRVKVAETNKCYKTEKMVIFCAQIKLKLKPVATISQAFKNNPYST